MEKNRRTINLVGQEFHIVGSGSSEYIKKLENMVNKRVEDVMNKYPEMSMNRCALLAMLNMADELYTFKRNYETLDNKISQLREMPRVTPSQVARPAVSKNQPAVSKEQTDTASSEKQPVRG